MAAARAAARERADRIEAEGDVDCFRRDAAARDQRCEAGRLTFAVGPEIELEALRSGELHALEGFPCKSRRIGLGETEAIGARSAGEDDLQTVGAVGEVVERQVVGGGGIGMVEASENLPGAGATQRARPFAAWIERLQPRFRRRRARPASQSPRL